jgi:hypothetical protein
MLIYLRKPGCKTNSVDTHAGRLCRSISWPGSRSVARLQLEDLGIYRSPLRDYQIEVHWQGSSLLKRSERALRHCGSHNSYNQVISSKLAKTSDDPFVNSRYSIEYYRLIISSALHILQNLLSHPTPVLVSTALRTVSQPNPDPSIKSLEFLSWLIYL